MAWGACSNEWDAEHEADGWRIRQAPDVSDLRHGPLAAPRSLRRTLGLWRVSLTGIGVILGAGVYALVGPAAAEAGNAMWLAFVLAGTTAGLTAYSYARFVRTRPSFSTRRWRSARSPASWPAGLCWRPT